MPRNASRRPFRPVLGPHVGAAHSWKGPERGVYGAPSLQNLPASSPPSWLSQRWGSLFLIKNN